MNLRDELISVVTFKALPFKLVQCIIENSLQREQYENNTKKMCRCNTIVEIRLKHICEDGALSNRKNFAPDFISLFQLTSV